MPKESSSPNKSALWGNSIECCLLATGHLWVFDETAHTENMWFQKGNEFTHHIERNNSLVLGVLNCGNSSYLVVLGFLNLSSVSAVMGLLPIVGADHL